jgi:hypothetical protein
MVFKNRDEQGAQEGDDVGKVVYTWQDGDTDTAGEFLMEVVLCKSVEISHDPLPSTFEEYYRTAPFSDYNKLIITARL